MTDALACAQVQELIPDLVTGAVSGVDRERADRHTAGCPRCRRALDEATAMVGQLLALAPEREPPHGFSDEVLRRLPPQAGAVTRHRRRPSAEARSRRPAYRRLGLVAVAASVAGAALAGGLVWRATSDDRLLADGYRRTLAAANGQYLLAQKLRTPDGSEAGLVFAYQGSISWIFVTVRTSGPYEVRLRTRTGVVQHVGTFLSTSWGTAIDVAVHDLSEIRLSRPDSADLVGPDLVAVIEVPPGSG